MPLRESHGNMYDGEGIPIPGYPGYYASPDGKIWSDWGPISQKGKRGITTGRTLIIKEKKQVIDKHGYPYVSVGAGKTRKVASLILIAFVGPRPKGMQARHLDGNPANSYLSNLLWGTIKENAQDQYRHGTRVCAERHHSCKLTTAQVKEIRRLYSSGEWKQTELAKKFKVLRGTIIGIIKNKTRITAEEERSCL